MTRKTYNTKAKTWQKDPNTIETNKVQYWTDGGTMMTAQMTKSDARELVMNKAAFAITSQAIGQIV